jgi:hypothetical protein
MGAVCLKSQWMAIHWLAEIYETILLPPVASGQPTRYFDAFVAKH